MQVCSNCGHKNRPGVIFCENCGTSLLGRAAVGTTKSFEEGSASAEIRDQVGTAGTDIFLSGSNLRIEIEGGPEPILAQPKQELIFGRRDPATGAMPDIDLTPYAGYRMGVSRRHAAIRSGDDNRLDVWDLGSSNGTFLNGQRLNAHRPYRLRDGDQLRLGQMIIRVYFQPPPTPAASDIPSDPHRPFPAPVKPEGPPVGGEGPASPAPAPDGPSAAPQAQAAAPVEAPAAPPQAAVVTDPAAPAEPEAPPAPEPASAASAVEVAATVSPDEPPVSPEPAAAEPPSDDKPPSGDPAA